MMANRIWIVHCHGTFKQKNHQEITSKEKKRQYNKISYGKIIAVAFTF